MCSIIGVTLWGLEMPSIPFISLTLNTSNWKLMIQRNTTSQHHVIPDLLNPGNQKNLTLVTMPIVNSQNFTLKYEVPHKNQGKLDYTQEFSLPPNFLKPHTNNMQKRSSTNIPKGSSTNIPKGSTRVTLFPPASHTKTKYY